jgi:excisionase family DNA binding protein
VICMPDMEEFYTPAEIATILKIEEDSVTRLLRQNKMPGYKVEGSWRVSKSEFLEQKEHSEQKIKLANASQTIEVAVRSPADPWKSEANDLSTSYERYAYVNYRQVGKYLSSLAHARRWPHNALVAPKERVFVCFYPLYPLHLLSVIMLIFIRSESPAVERAIQFALDDLLTHKREPSQDDLALIPLGDGRDIIEAIAKGLHEREELGARSVFNSLCRNIDEQNKLNGKHNWLRELRARPVPSRNGEEQEKPKELRYPLQELSYLKNKPRPKWAIDQIMFERGVSLFVGDGGSGKSTLVLNMLLSRACNVPFLNRDTKPAFVVWVAAESINELYSRIVACLSCHNIQEEQLTDMLFLDGRVPFNSTAEAQAFIQDTQAQLNARGITPETHNINFAFDTYARCTPGANENDTQETKLIADTILTISETFSAQVSVIHHTNAQGKIRGNTALRDAADTIWYVTKEDDTVKLFCDKMRGAREPEGFSVEVRSIVLDPNNLGAPDSTAPVIFPSNAKEEKFIPKAHLQMLQVLNARTQLTSGDWQKLCEEKHTIQRSTFYGHLKRLIAEDLVNAPSEEEKSRGKSVYYSLSPKGVMLLG